MIRALWAAALGGYLAYTLARVAGIPVWIDHLRADWTGDASDVGVLVAAFVWTTLTYLKGGKDGR